MCRWTGSVGEERGRGGLRKPPKGQPVGPRNRPSERGHQLGPGRGAVEPGTRPAEDGTHRPWGLLERVRVRVPGCLTGAGIQDRAERVTLKVFRPQDAGLGPSPASPRP